MVKAGIGAPADPPRGFFAVWRNFEIPSSPHRCQSALVDVMSGDVACQPRAGVIGATFNVAPFIHFDLSKSPSAVFGVWHSWHLATSSTRYLPRATFAVCPKSVIAAASANATAGTNNSLRFMGAS